MYRDSLSPVQQVDFAFYLLFGFSFAVLLILTGCACWFLWRYNHKRHPKAADIRGNLTAEVLWTLVPSLLIMGLFYYGWVGYQALRTVPKGALDVRVTARMWSWTFTYPNNKHSNMLVVPVNTPVKLTMATKDVIHSFFAPAFRIKMDTVPGMETYAWFEAKRAGDYDVFCAEYCGDKHSAMLAVIRAVDRDDYEKWMAQEESGPDAGQKLMDAQGCFACHSVDGSAGVGPTFKGVFGHSVKVLTGKRRMEVKVDEAYIIESIVKPELKITEGYDDTMPPYTDFTKEQLDDMVEYMKSLTDNRGDGGHNHSHSPAREKERP